ncbi:hypothetical protein PVAP13_8NG220903 [Panicum virgatum]|uniref:ASCH domain-containing protein n=2 Tax=Panicum virgatum TaxID=38727 RepID=A0A8T0P8L1_PANVG|nr:hypothetical protein PVAP13_8NG220903 [Panicum virgatum]
MLIYLCMRALSSLCPRITQGSLLLFNKCLLLNVEAVKKYSSFSEMPQAEIISNVLPGISSIEEGVKVYRKFYTDEREKSYGVLAISVSKPSVQPYTTMTDIFAGLGYDGLGRLLGMARTAGTVPDGLPPPRSVLISSSMRLHQPNVRGCSLTDAARALAKHVHRCTKGWWSDVSGSDSSKNGLASEAIDSLSHDCCWMNVHLTQPYGPVLKSVCMKVMAPDGLKMVQSSLDSWSPTPQKAFLKGGNTS